MTKNDLIVRLVENVYTLRDEIDRLQTLDEQVRRHVGILSEIQTILKVGGGFEELPKEIKNRILKT